MPGTSATVSPPLPLISHRSTSSPSSLLHRPTRPQRRPTSAPPDLSAAQPQTAPTPGVRRSTDPPGACHS
eukprot:scaffold292502_cov27-Tisochrysis_lutea.AAC.1